MFHKEIRQDIKNRLKIKKYELKTLVFRDFINDKVLIYPDLKKIKFKNRCLATGWARSVKKFSALNRINLRHNFSNQLFLNVSKRL